MFQLGAQMRILNISITQRNIELMFRYAVRCTLCVCCAHTSSAVEMFSPVFGRLGRSQIVKEMFGILLLH